MDRQQGRVTIDALRGQRCLVLGGGGFIGLNLCNALVAAGASVQAYGRHLSFPALDDQVVWTAGDFTDTATLARAVSGQDIVFHLISASIPESSNRDPSADLTANAIGTLHLLDLCRGEKVRKVVFTSSGGTVYGIPDTLPIPETAPTNPISAYGISKLAIEKYLALYRHLYGLDYHVLRVANPYGRFQSPHRKQGVVAAMMQRALRGEPLDVWGTGEVTRDFIHVDDVVDAILLSAVYEGPHRVMNVGSGEGLSINDIIRDIEAAMGRGPLSKTYRSGRAVDVPVNILDISLIKREFGWHPATAWRDGLADTLAWLSHDGNH